MSSHNPTAHILWTGATGFFGKSLLRHLKTRSTVTELWHLLSRDPAKFEDRWPHLARQPHVHWHRADVMSLAELQLPALTHVVHAAADSTDTSHLTPLERYDQIVTGTREVLDLAVRCGARRFLLISSGGSYGLQPANIARLSETYNGMADPLQAQNAYSIGKRAAEHLCSLYAQRYGLEVVVARCFAFVGEDLPLNAHFAIGNFIRDALWADSIVVQGDGTTIRSYLYQQDLVNWLLALLERGRSGQAYNVGSDQGISIADLAHQVRDLVSPEKPVRILGTPQSDATPHRYVPEIVKIQRELGMQLSYDLESAIKATASIHKAQGSMGMY